MFFRGFAKPLQTHCKVAHRYSASMVKPVHRALLRHRGHRAFLYLQHVSLENLFERGQKQHEVDERENTGLF
jgi:fructose-1,6-bisphosphatase